MIEYIGAAFAVDLIKAWKADEIDQKAFSKNGRAFTRQAEAIKKVEQHKEKLFAKMKINAIRKNAVLQCHIKRFVDVYSIIDEYQLTKGLGIREMERIDEVKNQMIKAVNLPSVASGLAKTDTQLIVGLALRGFGGTMIADAKANAKLASRNMANASAVSAQADSICIFYDALAERVAVCTDILQKLAAKDIVALNHVESMLQSKGCDESLYSQSDVDAINLCSELNILIYEIINTPLIDENNEITKASIAIINKGQEYLSQLA